jgi:hypothetical protein
LIVAGKCYAKIREITNEIKKSMMAYNPLEKQYQDKEVLVKYESDRIEQDQSEEDYRVVNLSGDRPSWFDSKLTRNYRKS